MNKNKSGVFALAFFLVVVLFSQIQIASAQDDSIYIRSDGSVEGTGFIRQDGNIYTLLSGFSKSIVIEKSDIIVDGKGAVLTLPSGGGTNIRLTQVNNITIKNMVIKDGYIGVVIENCTHVILSDNNITITDSPTFFYIAAAIRLENGGFHSIVNNNISNSRVGIWITESSHYNRIYHNNFINNKYHVFGDKDAISKSWWDNGYLSGGNYWDNYDGMDSYSGRYQNETGSDKIGDTPYFYLDYDNENETLFLDNFPLMKLVDIPEFSSWIILPLFLVSAFVIMVIKKKNCNVTL
ncbi:MAG: NosD domain-containing protein [archaeon]